MAVAHLVATAPGAVGIPFTPQPVVNWLYQVLGCTLSSLQGELGNGKRFDQCGAYRNIALTKSQPVAARWRYSGGLRLVAGEIKG